MSNSAAAILVISMIHAYVFAFLLFSKKHTAKNILGLYMLNIALEYFLLSNLEKFKIPEFTYLFYYLTPSITLNTIPLIYLYVRHMTSEKYHVTLKSIVHFTPSFLVLIGIILAGFKLNNGSIHKLYTGELTKTDDTLFFITIYGLSLLMLFGQIIGYAIHMFILLYKHSGNIENVFSSKEQVSLKWLKFFVIVYLGYSIFEVIHMLFLGESLSKTIYYSIISLHVFFVGILGLRQQNIYEKETKKNKKETKIEDLKKNISIPDELKNELKIKLEKLMLEEKMYLNHELSLYDICKVLNTNKNYLSHVINSNYGTNFYNYINSYRIEEAKKMLENSKYDNLSIEGIAKSVGFKSRGVFYPVFKKATGKTPHEYKKMKS